MKKQLLLSLTLINIVNLNAEHPMSFINTASQVLTKNDSTLTPIKDTGHYHAIPEKMRIGQTFTVPSEGHGQPYDTWQVTRKSGNAVTVFNNVITAKSEGVSQIKVIGTKKGLSSRTAIKTIRVTK